MSLTSRPEEASGDRVSFTPPEGSRKSIRGEPLGGEMPGLTVCHAVSDIARSSSGLCQVVAGLAEAMGKLGADSRVLTSRPGSAFTLSHVRHRSCSRSHEENVVSQLVSYARALRRECEELDILHVHGLWTIPNVVLRTQRRAGFPTGVVISPHGTLTPWALSRSSTKKRFAWLMYQRQILKGADCIHVTAEAEYEDVRRMGINAPVCIVPNGITLHPEHRVDPQTKAKPKRPRLLSLGRIHEKKGLDVLLRAWNDLGTMSDEWDLRIAGPLTGHYAEELVQYRDREGMNNVTFVGEVTGPEKLKEYDEADAFVLPSWSENFGLVVPEALSREVPVLTTLGTPWVGLLENQCGWWVAPGFDGIRNGLRAVLSSDPAELRRMGRRGSRWVEREFSWSRMARRLVPVYQWIHEGGEAPECVRM